MVHRATLLLLILAYVAVPAEAQQVEKVKGKPMYTVLPYDAIPSIDRPEFTDAQTAERFMRDEEMVIGVAIAGEARAYSAWHLDRHEIVNDSIAGRPIAVTW